MGITNDLKEYVDLWHNSSSKKGKIISVVFVIYLLAPLASLSDYIFKWKGFVLDGVNFYREEIIHPIWLFVKTHLNFDLAVEFYDLFFIYILTIGLHIKVANLGLMGALPRIFIHGIIFSYMLSAATEIEVIPYDFWLIFALIFLSPFLGAKLTGYTYSEAFIPYVPILTGCFLICVLAAINIGLHRTI